MSKPQSFNSQKPPGPGCDEFDPGSLSLEMAVAKILSAITPIRQHKTVPLRKSLGRVLAQDVSAPFNVPNHTNSAMDGYAFNANALDEQGLATLRVVGTAYAGKPYLQKIQPDETVKIMTGAVMPAGADTVVMQEYITQNNDFIRLDKAAKPKQNVRYAGEDIAKNSLVLKSGRRISSADLGLLASLGLTKVKILKKPRVAFFSNGDEVRKVGEPLGIGEVYDSNRHTLYAMLKQAGVKLIDLGVVGDDYDAIKQTIIKADKLADMVITSAGASVGEADYIYDILSALGEVSLWKIAIKPGRPLAFGKLPSSVFFGLPGNPVSVMTSYALCLSPALSKMRGEVNVAESKPLLIKAKVLNDLGKKPGRTEFQRATVFNDEDDKLAVRSRKYQGSGVLSSMADANCFIVLPLESAGVKTGDWVDIMLFSEVY